MLITTHTGIVVNSDHVAYKPLKKQAVEDREAQSVTAVSPLFKALLCFSNGDSVVAATELTREAAEFIRRDLVHHWMEGAPAFHVNESLRRLAEGAYFASEGEASARKKRR